MKNHVPVFVCLTILLIVFRFGIDKLPQLLFINALINVFSLFLVFFSVTEQLIEKVHIRIDDTGVPKDIAIREKKCKKIKTSVVSYTICSIIVVVYLIFFVSELGNDIISITSLGLSLVDKSVADSIANIIKI